MKVTVLYGSSKSVSIDLPRAAKLSEVKKRLAQLTHVSVQNMRL